MAAVALSCALAHAQSSRKLKESILKSWLFQSADLFYPHGAPGGDSPYPRLAARELAEVEETAQGHLRVISRLHEKDVSLLRELIGSSVPSRVKGLVLLQNNGEPVARSVVNNKGQLEVLLDVRVLQANFVSSLVAVAKSPSWFTEFDGRPRPLNATSDGELIAEFLKFKADVAAAPAANAFGDLRDTLGSLRSHEFKETRALGLVKFAVQAQPIHNNYLGTLLFLMGHEVGHFILGHHRSGCAADRCEAFAAQEEDADAYATILLTRAYSPFGSMSSSIPLVATSDLIGMDTFFNHAYERIGFKEQRTQACPCAYPPLSERKTMAGAVRDKVLAAIDKRIYTVPVK
jgi:hypothetical protein